MKLDRAREVVNTAPKTELGLAARLVLWELERREELADPQPKIAALTEQLAEARENADMWERRTHYMADSEGTRGAELRKVKEELLLALRARDDLAKEVAELRGRHDDELIRLRKLEAAVKDVEASTTVFQVGRSVQNRILGHLLPYICR